MRRQVEARIESGRSSWSAGVEAQACRRSLFSALLASRAVPPDVPSAKERRRRGRRLGHRRRAITRMRFRKTPTAGIQDRAGAGDAERLARTHLSRARELEAKDQLDAALLEYKRALELDAFESSGRGAGGRAREDRSAIASKPRVRSRAIDKLREEARRASTPLLNPTAPTAGRQLRSERQRPRHPEFHRHGHRHQRHLRPELTRTRRTRSASKTSRSSRRCSRSWRRTSSSTRS